MNLEFAQGVSLALEVTLGSPLLHKHITDPFGPSGQRICQYDRKHAKSYLTVASTQPRLAVVPHLPARFCEPSEHPPLERLFPVACIVNFGRRKNKIWFLQ